MGALAEIGSSLLLFFLVFGMSATVDIGNLRKAIRNRNALLTGVSMQFVILPFVGFVVVKVLNMSAPVGITLLVVTSSPGGSYSNWWCSMFNAELALSVTMTAISTLLSVIMLPVNLVIYATSSYSSAVVKSLDWEALFVSLIVVIGAISSGLICSAKINSHRFNAKANKLGNFAGIALVTYSIAISSTGSASDGDEDSAASLWQQDAAFYVGVASPAVLGLAIATYMASRFELEKPERVAVAVEACYQNTGIATSVAITMFSGDDLAVAIGVPLYYGIVEAVLLATYCLAAWKMGWTKAPPNENICVVIATSYEVEQAEALSRNAIEVVLGNTGDHSKTNGTNGDGGGTIISPPHDLIFAHTQEGYQIDEGSLNSLSLSGRGSTDDAESGTLATVSTEADPSCASPRRARLVTTAASPASQQGGGPSTPRIQNSEVRAVDVENVPSMPQPTRRRQDYRQVEVRTSTTDGPVMITAHHDGKITVATSSVDTSDSITTNDADTSIGSGNRTGRIGRAVSTLRARATGYREAGAGRVATYSEDPSSPQRESGEHADPSLPAVDKEIS